MSPSRKKVQFQCLFEGEEVSGRPGSILFFRGAEVGTLRLLCGAVDSFHGVDHKHNILPGRQGRVVWPHEFKSQVAEGTEQVVCGGERAELCYL